MATATAYESTDGQREQREGWTRIETDPKYTDLGNAERLVERHGEKLRYVPQWGWLVWDGKRWQRDETGQVMEFAKEMVSNLRREAAETRVPGRGDELWKHARSSESRMRLQAMVELARSDPAVVRTVDDFDKNPWLFTCQNGTLDLHDGTLHPHDPQDHIMKLAPVNYDPDARSEDWEQFLADVFEGDQDLIAYMQRAVGYSLTGSVREPAFFIPWGAGRNGKSTFFRAVTRVLGDYAKDTPVQTFMRKQFSGGATNDQAALAGARLITASEPEANQTLDIGLVKRITGGDPITARFLNKEFFTYTPQAKVWMATNHKPSIPENTTAVWARIKLIPFTVSFYGREDKTIEARLEAAKEAILAWAVQGCRDWQCNGLNDPDAVKAATQAYQAEQDELADFFTERCVFGAEHTVQSSVLYNEYKDWAHENNVPVVPSKQFAPLLTSLPGRNIHKGLMNGRVRFKGIGLAEHEQSSSYQGSSYSSGTYRHQPSFDEDDDIPF